MDSQAGVESWRRAGIGIVGLRRSLSKFYIVFVHRSCAVARNVETSKRQAFTGELYIDVV